MTPSTSAERLEAMMISLRDQVDQLALEVRAQRVAESRANSVNEKRISRLEASLKELEFSVKGDDFDDEPRARILKDSARVEVRY